MNLCLKQISISLPRKIRCRWDIIIHEFYMRRIRSESHPISIYWNRKNVACQQNGWLDMWRKIQSCIWPITWGKNLAPEIMFLSCGGGLTWRKMKYIANVSLVNFKGELYNDFKCMTKSDRTKNNIYNKWKGRATCRNIQEFWSKDIVWNIIQQKAADCKSGLKCHMI